MKTSEKSQSSPKENVADSATATASVRPVLGANVACSTMWNTKVAMEYPTVGIAST